MRRNQLPVLLFALSSGLGFAQERTRAPASHGVPSTRSLFGECDTKERILPGETPSDFHFAKEMPDPLRSFQNPLDKIKKQSPFEPFSADKPGSAFSQYEGRTVFNIFAYRHSIAEMLDRCAVGTLNRTSLTALMNKTRAEKKDLPNAVILMAAFEAMLANIADKELRKDISAQIRESGGKGIKAEPTQALTNRLLAIQKKLVGAKDPASALASLTPSENSLLRLFNERYRVDGQTVNIADLLFGYDISQHFRFLGQDGNPKPGNNRYTLNPSDSSFLFNDAPKMQKAEDQKILDRLKTGFEMKLKDPTSFEGLNEIVSATRDLDKLSVEGADKWRSWLRDRLSDFPSGQIQSSSHGAKSGDWLRQSYTRSALQSMAFESDRKYHADLPNVLADLPMDDGDYANLLDIERAIFAKLPQKTKEEVDELARYVGRHFNGAKINALSRLTLAGQSMRDRSTPEDLSPFQRELLVHLSRNPKSNSKALATAILQGTTTTVMEFALKTPETRKELYSLLAARLKASGLPPEKLAMNVAETETADFEKRRKLHEWATQELLSKKRDEKTQEALALLIASLEETGHDPQAIAMLHRGRSRFHPPYVAAEAHMTQEILKKVSEEDKRVVKEFERFLYHGKKRGLPIASRNALLALPATSKAKLADILMHAGNRTGEARDQLEALIITADEAAIETQSALARPEVNAYINAFAPENLSDEVVLSLMTTGTVSKEAKRALESLAMTEAREKMREMVEAGATSSQQLLQSLYQQAYASQYMTLLTEAALRLLTAGKDGSPEHKRALEILQGDAEAFADLKAEAELRNHVGTNLEKFLASENLSSMPTERKTDLPPLQPQNPERYEPKIKELTKEMNEYDASTLARARTIGREMIDQMQTVQNHQQLLEATKRRTFGSDEERQKEIKRVEELVRQQTAAVKQLQKDLQALQKESSEKLDALKTALDAAYQNGYALEGAEHDEKYSQLAAKYIAEHSDLSEFDAEQLAPSIVAKLKEYRRRQDQLKTLAETQNSTSHEQFLDAWKKQVGMPGHLAHLSEQDQAKALRQAEKKAQSDLKKRYEKRDKLIGELEKVGVEFDGVQLTHGKANIHQLPPGRFEAIMKELGQWDNFKAEVLARFDSIGHNKGVFKLNDQTAVEVVSGWEDGQLTEDLRFKPIGPETKRLEKLADEVGKLIDELPTLRRTQEGYFSQSLPKLLHGYPASAIEAVGIPLDPRVEQFFSLRQMWLPGYFGEPEFEIKDGQTISRTDKKIAAQEALIEKKMKDLEANAGGLALGYRGVERSGADLTNLFKEKMALHSQASIEGAKNSINDIEWTRNIAIEGLVTVPLVMASGGAYGALRGAVAAGRFGAYTRNVRRAMAFAKLASGGTKGVAGMLRFSAMSTTASMATGTYMSYYGASLGGYGTIYGGEYQAMNELMTRDEGQWKGDEWFYLPNGKPDWMDHRDANKQLLVSSDKKYKDLVLKPEFDKNGNQIPDAAEGTFDFFTHLPTFGSYANQLQRGAITFAAAKPLGLITKMGTAGFLPASRWTQNMFGMMESTALNDGFISPYIENRITSNAKEASSWEDIGKQSVKNVVYMAPFDDLAAMGMYSGFRYLTGSTKGLSLLNGTSRVVTSALRKPYTPFKAGDILPAAVAQPVARLVATEFNQQTSGLMAVYEHYSKSPKTGEGDTRGGYFSSGSNVRSRSALDAYLKGRVEGLWGDFNAGKVSAGDGLSHFARGELLRGADVSKLTEAGYNPKDLKEGLESIETRDLDPANPKHQRFFERADAGVAGGNIRDAFVEEKKKGGVTGPGKTPLQRVAGYFRQQESFAKTVEPRLQRQVATKLYLDDTLSLQQALSKVVHPGIKNNPDGTPSFVHKVDHMLRNPVAGSRETALKFITDIPASKMVTLDAEGQNPAIRDTDHKAVVDAIARQYNIPEQAFEAHVIANAAKKPAQFSIDDMAVEYQGIQAKEKRSKAKESRGSTPLPGADAAQPQ